MPSTYKASTYAASALWQEKTKVQYAPNPKSGKSKIRYEAYAKATTIGESLDFGSKPEDLLFDFEHGHLQIKGQLRKEPLLLDKIKDFNQLSYTDLVLSRFSVRVNPLAQKADQDRITAGLDESLKAARANLRRVNKFKIAGKYGIKDVDDLQTQGHFESTEMRAHRTIADKEASNVLNTCKQANRKVSDHEVLRVLRLWDFRENEARRNVMQPGQEFVYSDTAGVTADRTGLILLKEEVKLYPGFARLLNQWLIDHMPEDLGAEFVWTSININKNYAGRLHRDGSNVGPSFIKAFGDFKGGALNYYPEDDRSAKLEELAVIAHDKVKMKINKGLMLFDGNRGHEVDPFEGERYSLVYFTAPRYWKLPAQDQKQLQDCGFKYPSKTSIGKLWSVVKPAKGYKALSAAAKQRLQEAAKRRGKTLKGTKSAESYRFWSHETAEYKRLEANAEKFWSSRKPESAVRTAKGLEMVEKFAAKKRKADEQPWNAAQSLHIGSELTKGKNYLVTGPNTVVDAADLLNKSPSEAPARCLKDGICAVYSNRTRIYYGMYVQGAREKAFKTFGVTDPKIRPTG